jgi:hypothetical protein
VLKSLKLYGYTTGSGIIKNLSNSTLKKIAVCASLKNILREGEDISSKHCGCMEYNWHKATEKFKYKNCRY